MVFFPPQKLFSLFILVWNILLKMLHFSIVVNLINFTMKLNQPHPFCIQYCDTHFFLTFCKKRLYLQGILANLFCYCSRLRCMLKLGLFRFDFGIIRNKTTKSVFFTHSQSETVKHNCRRKAQSENKLIKIHMLKNYLRECLF